MEVSSSEHPSGNSAPRFHHGCLWRAHRGEFCQGVVHSEVFSSKHISGILLRARRVRGKLGCFVSVCLETQTDFVMDLRRTVQRTRHARGASRYLVHVCFETHDGLRDGLCRRVPHPDTFNVPAMYEAILTILPLFAAGHTTGNVMDSGVMGRITCP